MVEPVCFVAVGCVLLVLACLAWNQPRETDAVETRPNILKGLEEPPDLFYARTYQRLRENLERAGLPDCRVGFGSRHLFGHRTVFGARPRYLCIRYDHLTFYIYAYQLPAGLYVSYRCFSRYIKGLLPQWRVRRMTLYQFDIMDMCTALILGSLDEVIDAYAQERGLQPLEAHERRPVLHSFYARHRDGETPAVAYILPASTLPANALPAGNAAPLGAMPPGAAPVGTALPVSSGNSMHAPPVPEPGAPA